MRKRCIYAKDDFKIVSLKVDINKKLIIKILDNYETDDNSKTSGLYNIIYDILKCTDNLFLSYLISDLMNYEVSSKTEQEIIDKVLLCIHLKKYKNIFDVKRILLNLEYKLDLFEADPYYVDENTINPKIDRLPFVK
ncbi:unknown [Clostridium sp. CAG:594]|nr:unknown [Clostridium sp. CAG:594]